MINEIEMPYKVTVERTVEREDPTNYKTRARWCDKQAGKHNWGIGDFSSLPRLTYEFVNEKDAVLFALRFG